MRFPSRYKFGPVMNFNQHINPSFPRRLTRGQSRSRLPASRHRAVAPQHRALYHPARSGEGRAPQHVVEVFDAALLEAGIRSQYRDRFADRGDGILALIHPVDQAPRRPC